MFSRITLIVLISIFSSLAFAEKTLNIVTCEPHWAYVASEIGKQKVKVSSLLGSVENPANYSFTTNDINHVAKADMLICTGSGLEDEWLNKLISKSKNTALTEESGRLIYVSKHVPLIQERKKDIFIDLAYPDGNPHIHMNPEIMVRIGRIMQGAIGYLLPNDYQYLKENLLAYTHQLQTSIVDWKNDIEKLKEKSIIVGHDYWPYMALWTEIKIVDRIRSEDHDTRQLKKRASIRNPQLCILANHESVETIESIINEAGIKVNCVKIPYSFSDWENPESLIKWYGQILNTLTKSL